MRAAALLVHRSLSHSAVLRCKNYIHVLYGTLPSYRAAVSDKTLQTGVIGQRELSQILNIRAKRLVLSDSQCIVARVQ